MSAASHSRGQAIPGPALVLTVLGAACVVAGGLVAAATGPLDLAHGSWMAAYLVLVGGVAQHVMGRVRSSYDPSRWARWGWMQVLGWNGGNALVIGGTQVDVPLLVDLGSVLLVGALVVALYADRGARGPLPLRWGYRLLLLVMALSIPIGIVLSHLRHG
ncbi:hypothetical protein [Nocardioides jensenii]|uniref:hypothetical protein n=1 Tax=Nocardioides jensenii TaxID=1843 RepID=UPI00082F1B07|nr:hypothetical protein [Nocardioides jensenii]